MAQLYVSGPVDIWVATGSAVGQSPVPKLLGHTERGPRIEIIDKWRPIKSDDAGDTPADVAWMGEEALVFCDVNRWDESVYEKLASRPVFSGIRGRSQRRDIGRLMLRNKLTFQLWLRFSNAQFSTMGGAVDRPGVPGAQGGFGVFPTFIADARQSPMPDGYTFFYAYLIGPDKLDPLGTRLRKIQLMFHAVSKLNSVRGATITTANNNQGGQPARDEFSLLYDTDMSGLPPITALGSVL